MIESIGNSFELAKRIGVSEPAPPVVRSRDLIVVFFRRRRLIISTFIISLAVVCGVIAMRGPRYEARMEFLVKRERVDAVVTTEANATRMSPQGSVTEEDINSEIALIDSQDLLANVVKICHLDNQPSLFAKWNLINEPAEIRTVKAIKRLARDLKVEPVRKSDLVEVRYSSKNPQLSLWVLNTVRDLYLSKHLEVHRPIGESQFFRERSEEYKKALLSSEQQLAAFAQQAGSVSPHAERDLILQKLVDQRAAAAQSSALVSGSEQRVAALQKQLAITPERLQTQSRQTDNPQLMEKLKSTLLDLQLKRTQLVTKFDDSYPSVQEIDRQISQTQNAIASENRLPLVEQTTDANPTYQLIASELSKAKADLMSEQAIAAKDAGVERTYQERLMALENSGYAQEDLVRQVKSNEQNFLLYQQKSEEARISDALDKQRISNIAIAEAPVAPLLPSESVATLLGGGILLSIFLALGSAFVGEYFDSTFRTPDDVQRYLGLPLLAAIPHNSEAQESGYAYLVNRVNV